MMTSLPAFGSPSRSARDQTADDRDVTAEDSDDAAAARDERSDARDARADARQNTMYTLDAEAIADRTAARRDRHSSYNDRRAALYDRTAAAADRHLAARERASLIIDVLTGVRLRQPGLAELDRDLARATATRKQFVLVLVLVCVDGLKKLNDTKGHRAGDHLLQAVVATITACMHHYDLVVRYSGNQFLCGVTDLPRPAAAALFESARAAFVAAGAGSFSIGLAGPTPGNTDLPAMIARAEQAMALQRRQLLGRN